MMLINKFFRLSALLLPLFALIIPGIQLNAAISHQPFEIHRFTLKNGLKVWCQPRPDSKSVVTYIVFRVGSRCESRENNGISHFIEHMVFTGTKKWNEIEVKDIIRGRGGRMNGWTAREETVYFAEVSAGDFDIAMEWLSQITFHPTFPAGKVEKEKKVILQEKGETHIWLDNFKITFFGGNLDKEVRAALYPDSSLTLRVIGEKDSLRKINREELIDYYHKYYLPANAGLIIVGNVTPEVCLEKSVKYFDLLSEKPAHPLPQIQEWQESGPYEINIQELLLLNQRCWLMVGARTVGLANPDYWVLTVLAKFLQNDLIEEIRYKKGLVYGLRAYNRTFSDTGYFVIKTNSEIPDKEKILHTIKAHLEKIRRGEIDKVKLQKAKACLLGEWARYMENNLSRADWLREWIFVVKKSGSIPEYEAIIKSVTAGDLSRVVRTYFTPGRSYIAVNLSILKLFILFVLFITAILIVLLIKIKKRIRVKKSVDRSREENKK
ncbi:MAG: insulinase family protein [Candidatus Aminicenantes bacterium]|nr:MAG: insulinase family protein [Candidatus Aminicenantes bacterium]